MYFYLAELGTGVGIGLIALGAGIAVLTGFSQGIADGRIVAATLEQIGRNPEANGVLTKTMIIGIALSETTAIYAFVIACLLIFLLPGYLG